MRKRWPPGSKNIYDEIVGLRHPRGHSEFLSANVQKRCIAKSFNIYHNKKLITHVGNKKVSANPYDTFIIKCFGIFYFYLLDKKPIIAQQKI